jgi:hypothetical protein
VCAFLEIDANHVGQPIAQDGADHRSAPDRPEAQARAADQSADAYKHNGRRDEEGHDCKRLGKAECRNDERRPALMSLGKGDHVGAIVFNIDISALEPVAFCFT